MLSEVSLDKGFKDHPVILRLMAKKFKTLTNGEIYYSGGLDILNGGVTT